MRRVIQGMLCVPLIISAIESLNVDICMMTIWVPGRPGCPAGPRVLRLQHRAPGRPSSRPAPRARRAPLGAIGAFRLARVSVRVNHTAIEIPSPG